MKMKWIGKDQTIRTETQHMIWCSTFAISEQPLATWNEHNDEITHSNTVKHPYVENWGEIIIFFDGDGDGGKWKRGTKPSLAKRLKKRRRPIWLIKVQTHNIRKRSKIWLVKGLIELKRIFPMGRLFIESLSGPRIFKCKSCKVDSASPDHIVSKAFQGRFGRAYLFRSV